MEILGHEKNRSYLSNKVENKLEFSIKIVVIGFNISFLKKNIFNFLLFLNLRFFLTLPYLIQNLIEKR